MSDITIRNSRPADAPELRRLAALDSQRLPAGDLLVAEVCGEIVAALAPESAKVVADPFRRTADVVEILHLRANGGREATRERRNSLLPLPRTA